MEGEAATLSPESEASALAHNARCRLVPGPGTFSAEPRSTGFPPSRGPRQPPRTKATCIPNKIAELSPNIEIPECGTHEAL